MRNHGNVWIVLANEAGARILRRRAGETNAYEELAPEAFSVADLVNHAAIRGLFDALVLVAPSRTLAPLRRALVPAASERLVREVARDFLGLPDLALSARLTLLLRRPGNGAAAPIPRRPPAVRPC